MKTLLFTSALLAIILSGPAAAVDISGGTEADRAQMMSHSKIWVDSYLSGDLEGMMGLMHEDAMIMAANSETVRGLNAVRAYLATRVGQPGVEFKDDLKEIRINGSWAFVRGDFHLTVTPPGAPEPVFRRHGRYLVLYEKNAAGDWLMLRDMDNSVPLE
jgi:ketosteroid isomerase-like protein